MRSKNLLLGREKDGGAPVYIDPKTRSTHMQIIGSTGEGKSKFMEHLIREDIINDHGLCLIDPHGYLYNDIVKWCETKFFVIVPPLQINKTAFVNIIVNSGNSTFLWR